MLNILADPNIPFVEPLFARFGRLELKPGRQWSRDDVRHRDLLLVRSVTAVNAQLLEGSAVRMVATATSGTDHVDTNYLADAGIQFADAAGSNAIAVAEYVLSCLCLYAARVQRPLQDLCLGIIGCGHVGQALAHRAQVLELECLRNDPPLAEHKPELAPHSLATTLTADVVSLHVPLTDEGAHPTRALLDEAALGQMYERSALINAARGGVVDEAALQKVLEDSPDRLAILDCWEGEPAISARMLAKTFLSTPHIAGYSADGRLRGTAMLYESVREYFDFNSLWPPENLASVYPSPPPLSVDDKDDDAALRKLILGCYDVRSDSNALAGASAASQAAPGKLFDALRRHYPERREFASRSVYRGKLSETVLQKARALGFAVLN